MRYCLLYIRVWVFRTPVGIGWRKLNDRIATEGDITNAILLSVGKRGYCTCDVSVGVWFFSASALGLVGWRMG